jgi:D-beta-D-heptose 7-phosphate kinase / D-beta-D-heptose 1-phosphate adenosyltransferase
MFRSPETIRQLIKDGFGRRRVLVVGDLMLDAYLWGDVSRISPEAPVPVVKLSRRSETPGGAGNVARNLSELGLDVVVIGVVGEDEPGRRLAAFWRSRVSRSAWSLPLTADRQSSRLALSAVINRCSG